MLNDLRRLFQKSVDALRQELNRREPEDQVSDLLSSMRQELVEARAALPLLEQEVQRARQARDREREELERCERRGTLAERIGDAETARVAAEFATRHRERLGVLEKKLAAAEAEREMRTHEAAEMKRRYQEADANRFALLAQLRQQRTRQRLDSALGGQEGSFADWSRLEDAVHREAGYADALEELDESPRGGSPPGASAAEVEARLEELKRRMGKQ